jgi:hypothetical protein
MKDRDRLQVFEYTITWVVPAARKLAVVTGS